MRLRGLIAWCSCLSGDSPREIDVLSAPGPFASAWTKPIGLSCLDAWQTVPTTTLRTTCQPVAPSATDPRIVTVVTPRGEVEVARQEMRGLRRGSSWTWFWVAHRKGGGRWTEASTPREAIRRAMLLPPGKLPGWLFEVAAEAERQVTSDGTEGAPTIES